MIKIGKIVILLQNIQSQKTTQQSGQNLLIQNIHQRTERKKNVDFYSQHNHKRNSNHIQYLQLHKN